MWGSVSFAAVKWNPGHYVMLVGSGNGGKNSSSYMAEIYKEMASHKAIRGIAIRYDWSEIEKTKGVYDFTSIDKHLADLTKVNKQLIILLEYKSFTPDILIPAYMRTAEYEGGVIALGSNGVIKGYNIKLWNTAVYNRMVALVTAIGKHLNSHPNFEGFGLQETAMGQVMKPLTSVQVNGFYNNLINVDKAAKAVFTETMVFQLMNYPRNLLDSMIGDLKTMGATVGATDIFIDEPGLNFVGTKYTSDGLYLHFPRLAGTISLLAQVEKSNYENTRHDKKGYKPTITEILKFGRDELHANYILWTRSPEYFNNVLEVLNQADQTVNASGGLESMCPTTLTCK